MSSLRLGNSRQKWEDFEGLTNRQVGQHLGLAEQTVANNLFRMYEKLRISSRVELVLYARKLRQG